jgi:hypothetical protein
LGDGIASVGAFDDGVDRVDFDVVSVAEASKPHSPDRALPEPCVFGGKFCFDEWSSAGLGQRQWSYNFRLDPISYATNSGKKH